MLNEDKSRDNSSGDVSPKDINSNNEKTDDTKLSRTQRAINAKDERYKKVVNEDNSKNQEGFTRDGIEALKPFQPSVSKEESHSS